MLVIQRKHIRVERWHRKAAKAKHKIKNFAELALCNRQRQRGLICKKQKRKRRELQKYPSNHGHQQPHTLSQITVNIGRTTHHM